MSARRAADAPDLTYTIARVGPSAYEIAIDAPAAPSGDTVFALDAWGGIDDPATGIGDVREASGAPVAHPTPTTWRVHATGRRVSITYALVRSPLELDNRFRPLASEHLVHFIGNTALLYPQHVDGERHVRVVWQGFDGWRVASSHGTDVIDDYIGPLEEFRDAVFFASDRMRVVERPVAGTQLVLAIDGKWAFTDDELADRIAAIVAMERAFFSDPGPPRFVVTLVQLGEPHGGYGGTGLTTSFSLAMNRGARLDNSISELVAHEYFHTWDGQQIIPDGREDLAYWFTEGFTQFYTWRLLYRGGLVSLDDYVAELDRALVAYAASPVRELPNARIGEGFWTSPDVDKLPYLRGALVAAVLDREIRRASAGARDLDSVMRALAGEGRAGKRVTTESLLARFAAEASPAVAERLRATVVDGATLAIDRDAFEPCLSGAVDKRVAFELGFDAGGIRGVHKVVGGVVPGSAAERAGVHDGDELDGVDITFGDADPPVRHWVTGRGAISYVPKRELDVLVLGVHDRARCADVLGAAVRAGAR